jgi:hypothetical protein
MSSAFNIFSTFAAFGPSDVAPASESHSCTRESVTPDSLESRYTDHPRRATSFRIASRITAGIVVQPLAGINMRPSVPAGGHNRQVISLRTMTAGGYKGETITGRVPGTGRTTMGPEVLTADAMRISISQAPSLPFVPCRIIARAKAPEGGEMWEWENDRYYGTVRHYPSGFFVGNCEWAVIGISAIDETAAHDWRDFQRIKNDLVGREWEGAELYPAESRLKDPSNRFYLWCAPRGCFQFGWDEGRVVLRATESIAPQRPFHDEVLPEIQRAEARSSPSPARVRAAD